MLSGNYKILYSELVSKIDSSRVFYDPLSTLAYGTDASFYRLIPKIVIKAENEKEVCFILEQTAKLNISVTFRAAGTSLSGQAITDSVLIIAGYHWKEHEIIEEGNAIKLQPGIVGARANILLAPYNRKIGPDPASINTAMIGGIAANNASGMCCGTAQNSYNTLRSMRIVFVDGTVLDTSSQESKNEFLAKHPDFLRKILEISNTIKEDTVLAERIAGKFKMKNTTGYSLNAFIDFDDAFEIIEHLLIGSEGTLGFISEITYNTVENHNFKATSLMVFKNIEIACNVVLLLKNTEVAAVELMDRAALRSVENESGMPSYLKALGNEACALLVDTRAHDQIILKEQIQTILDKIATIPTEVPVVFTTDAKEYALLWKIRKGLFPSVGAIRQKGTTVIIEDVVFKIHQLAEATLELQKLFKKWNYNEAVIFGHALEGNLHFVFTQNFDTQSEIERYAHFMDDVVDLVVTKFDGALKAEHGTGRNMAPFVEMEWGQKAYALMKEIKAVFDPNYLLNPGVILNEDSNIHLKNLKPIPIANDIIDSCMECGFCEPNCVSADLTLSPRQRIVVHREISRLTRENENSDTLSKLLTEYQYKADDTCATDGLCALSCPVKIDTGSLIKSVRKQNVQKSQKSARRVANQFEFVTATLGKTLTVVGFFQKMIGNNAMATISGTIRRISGNRIPLWNKFMPSGASRLMKLENQVVSTKKVVYFSSCINRTMGVSKEDHCDVELSKKMIQLLNKGGYEVIYPENINSLCCGMPFSSKGYSDIGEIKANDLETALNKASENGKWPVLCDMSPCLYTMRENLKGSLQLVEPVEFIHDILLPNLNLKPINETITVFPVCSMKKMGLEDKLIALAQKCAVNVVVPEANCCGFSGDRGFDFPELNAFGLAGLKKNLAADVKRGFSNSRTCEIGLSLHTGISYQSIVYLVDEVSESK